MKIPLFSSFLMLVSLNRARKYLTATCWWYIHEETYGQIQGDMNFLLHCLGLQGLGLFYSFTEQGMTFVKVIAALEKLCVPEVSVVACWTHLDSRQAKGGWDPVCGRCEGLKFILLQSIHWRYGIALKLIRCSLTYTFFFIEKLCNQST